jgi:hypothetical protein
MPAVAPPPKPPGTEPTATVPAAVAEAPATPRKTGPPSRPVPLASAEKPRPRPVRAGHPELREPSQKASAGRQEEHPTDLLRTVIQAAGELVSVTASVAGLILKRFRDLLPR